MLCSMREKVLEDCHRGLGSERLGHQVGPKLIDFVLTAYVPSSWHYLGRIIATNICVWHPVRCVLEMYVLTSER